MAGDQRGVILCQIGDMVVVDVCYEENHELGNIVTDHPVEQGIDISDHVRPQPDRVNLRCWVSDTPMSLGQQQQAFNEGLGVSSSVIQAVPGRGKSVFDRLKDLRDQGTLIQLITTLKTYGLSSTTGMVIERLSVPRTTKNYNGLEWNMTLKQILIVENKFSQQAVPKDPRVAKKKKLGAQNTTDATNENSTLLNQATNLSHVSNASMANIGNIALNQQQNVSR